MTTPTLRKKAIAYILSKIQADEIDHKDIIKESDLCQTLEISRTPVREALIELERDGILEKIPNKGYVVKESSPDYKLNIFDILGSLDGLAARLAFPFITEEDLLRMCEYVDLIDVAIEYKNYLRYYTLQEEFHLVYINKCQNPVLIDLLSEYKLRVSRYTYFSEDKQKLFKTCQEVNDQHRQMIDMFRHKKMDELTLFMQNVHWNTAYYDMI